MAHVLFAILFFTFPYHALSHGGGLNVDGCHKNNNTGEYHCHRENKLNKHDAKQKNITKPDEKYFNEILSKYLNGRTEVTLAYNFGLPEGKSQQANIRIDIETDNFVIEGGLDNRSSLDSIQQAVFASSITKKSPAVAIYDTDGHWGRFEHRVWQAAKKLKIRFIWVSEGKVIEK